MRIWNPENPCDPFLMLDCDDDYDAEVLNEFARVGEPLVAVLKKDPSYLHPHLEIRKENP